MNATEIINEYDKNFTELAQVVYDMGVYRRVATGDGYKVRKEKIEEIRTLLNKLEELNEDLK